jgi:ABC-type amino acid transport system permease subunit
MEQVIETLASGLGNSVAWLAETGVLFAIFGLIWVAFGVALVWSQGSLDAAWQSVRGLPLIVQGIVWLLFLPVMIGLWVWETTWPLILRLLLIVGIAGWNLIVFLPRALQAVRP